ncbi:MAG: hypothetical protein GXX90_11290 [Microbacteriaceae bacterium]|nr:hypothetical protein [Microbacteriaceae bacterium]
MRLIRTAELTEPTTSAYRLRRRADDGAITRLYPGVYLDGSPGTAADTLPEIEHVAKIAAVEPKLTRAVISGPSAAILHGLPITRKRLTGKVRVNRASGGPGSDWLEVRRAPLDPDEIASLYGIRVTSLDRTIRDLCSELPFDELLAIADAALHLGATLVPGPAGSRGVRVLARLREHASLRSESWLESMSRASMIEAGLPMPLEQIEVLDEHGDLCGRSDFGWPEFAALGEADGRSKYDELLAAGETAVDAVHAEKMRENRMRMLGWQFLRWGAESAGSAKRMSRLFARLTEPGASIPAPAGHYRLAAVRPYQPLDWSTLLGRPRQPDGPAVDPAG